MTQDHEIHDFDNTVVAVLDERPETNDAASTLDAEGFDFEVLSGAEGREHLDPSGETSGLATVKRLLNAFGDQYRVLERLNHHLDEGRRVVSVEVSDDDSARAVEILQEHGGEYIWKFGTWTFTRIGE